MQPTTAWPSLESDDARPRLHWIGKSDPVDLTSGIKLRARKSRQDLDARNHRCLARSEQGSEARPPSSEARQLQWPSWAAPSFIPYQIHSGFRSNLQTARYDRHSPGGLPHAGAARLSFHAASGTPRRRDHSFRRKGPEPFVRSGSHRLSAQTMTALHDAGWDSRQRQRAVSRSRHGALQHHGHRGRLSRSAIRPRSRTVAAAARPSETGDEPTSTERAGSHTTSPGSRNYSFQHQSRVQARLAPDTATVWTLAARLGTPSRTNVSRTRHRDFSDVHSPPRTNFPPRRPSRRMPRRRAWTPRARSHHAQPRLQPSTVCSLCIELHASQP